MPYRNANFHICMLHSLKSTFAYHHRRTELTELAFESTQTIERLKHELELALQACQGSRLKKDQAKLSSATPSSSSIIRTRLEDPLTIITYFRPNSHQTPVSGDGVQDPEYQWRMDWTLLACRHWPSS